VITTFESVLARAVELLRGLPRRREAIAAARADFERFRQAQGAERAELLVDSPPGSPWVEYDVLLEHPMSGTVALSWRADDGSPWTVDHATHWAANQVVTVNSRRLIVPQALLYLNMLGRRRPDLMEGLVEQELVAEVIAKEPAPVTDEELQQAADAFRTVYGLYGAEATQRWLAEMGMSEQGFEELVAGLVRHQKLEERIGAGRVEPHFERHRRDYDRLQFFRVETPEAATAEQLAQAASKDGLLVATQGLLAGTGAGGLRGWLDLGLARDLPPALAGAAAGSVVGPVAGTGGHWVAEVLARQAAVLDAPTRAAIQDVLLREWLAERRSTATVQWHWM
jgi:putative peptide maturation system protein